MDSFETLSFQDPFYSWWFYWWWWNSCAILREEEELLTAARNRFPPDFNGGVGRGHGLDEHGSADDVALSAEEDAIAERTRPFIGPRLDPEFVVHVLFQVGEDGFGRRRVPLRHDAVVHPLVELDQVAGDSSVPVFQRWDLPADDHDVWCLEPVRYIRWWTCSNQKIRHFQSISQFWKRHRS